MVGRRALLAVPLVTLIALAAVAQPKARGARPRPAKKPAVEAAPEALPDAGEEGRAEPGAAKGDPKADQAADAGSVEATSEGPGDDLGAAPPPGVAEGGPRPSPLNPAPSEFPDGGAPALPATYHELMGEIALLRGRVAALSETLFASKLRVAVQHECDHARLSRLVLTLDGGVVYTAPARFSAEQPVVVFERALAPGHHVLGVEVERYDVRGQQYQTWQTSQFSLVVPEGQRLRADLSIADDSDMAEAFPEDRDGEYQLDVRLRATVDD